MSADDLKKVACGAIDAAAADLNTISQEIWSHPEESYQERYAHKILTDYLEQEAFPVERHYVLETGFRAVYGTGCGTNISVLCEYDSLPEIGHACGHNLIAEVGIGAAIGIKAALDAAKLSGRDLGKLTVLGTPAEEGGGGKIDMIKGGAFDGIDAALMAHPAPYNLADAHLSAIQEVQVSYRGKASHAAAAPWEGINALDAVVLSYNNIAVLRQQMKPNWRVHGIIQNGGAKPNITPEEGRVLYYARTHSSGDMATLKAKLTSCFKAAADATGCEMEMTWDPKPYDNTISNPTLTSLYTSNAESLGVVFDAPLVSSGSTDMGNVGHLLPSIHPMFFIGKRVANHSREFADAAGLPAAQPYTLDQAKALAMTAIDVYCQPHLVATMRTELKQQLETEQEA